MPLIMILDGSLWSSLRNGCDEEVSWPGFFSPLLSSKQGNTFWFVLKLCYVDEKLVAVPRKKTQIHMPCLIGSLITQQGIAAWTIKFSLCLILVGLSVLLGWGKQSCHLMKTDGGDGNHEKPYKVQNNTFKEKHTNIRVTVINWATKVVWCSGRNGQFTMVGKCWNYEMLLLFFIWEKCNCHKQVSGKFVTNGYILELNFKPPKNQRKTVPRAKRSGSPSADTSVQKSLGQTVIGLQMSDSLVVNLTT